MYDQEPTCTTTDTPELTLHPDFGDVDVLFNIRDWLRDAIESKGAEFTGGGIGMGAADIDMRLDGFDYNISIRPIPRVENKSDWRESKANKALEV